LLICTWLRILEIFNNKAYVKDKVQAIVCIPYYRPVYHLIALSDLFRNQWLGICFFGAYLGFPQSAVGEMS
jgi:hypothetical protein